MTVSPSTLLNAYPKAVFDFTLNSHIVVSGVWCPPALQSIRECARAQPSFPLCSQPFPETLHYDIIMHPPPLVASSSAPFTFHPSGSTSIIRTEPFPPQVPGRPIRTPAGSHGQFGGAGCAGIPGPEPQHTPVRLDVSKPGTARIVKLFSLHAGPKRGSGGNFHHPGGCESGGVSPLSRVRRV